MKQARGAAKMTIKFKNLMVDPRIRFLNLMVILAAPRACFMTEKFMTLYGSLSISTVSPFFISDVSIATLRALWLRVDGARNVLHDFCGFTIKLDTLVDWRKRDTAANLGKCMIVVGYYDN